MTSRNFSRNIQECDELHLVTPAVLKVNTISIKALYSPILMVNTNYISTQVAMITTQFMEKLTYIVNFQFVLINHSKIIVIDLHI